MKKLTKKCLVTLLALGMIATASTTAFASDVEAGENYIQNEYLKITEELDDFYIDTTGGDPDNANDDGKLLLYKGSNIGGTSDMLVEVDGSMYRTDDSNAEMTINTAEKSITTVYPDFCGVSLKRVLTFVANDSTGREDTVEIKFVVTNNDTVEHSVGARIMLDTMLGNNDYAPFRVPGIGAVTTRTQLNGSEIPVMYQAFDDLENPSVISTGSFATGAGRPDYIQFNNYSESTSNVLGVNCDTESSLGDSVVNAVWSPATLAAGESKEFKVYYGLGAVTVNNESELVLGATKVEQNFEVNEEGTGYNPVSIMGYIKNSGDVDLSNVEISIELPDGVSLVDCEGNVNFGTVAIDGENQTTWTMNANPVGVEKEITVTINAKSDETGAVTPITYTYTLPAIEGIPTEPVTEAPTEAPTDEPTVAPTQAPTAVATQLPTVAPTQATQKATTATSATSATTVTTTTTTTGKVATGNSMASIMVMGGLLAVSGTVVFMNRKRRAGEAE